MKYRIVPTNNLQYKVHSKSGWFWWTECYNAYELNIPYKFDSEKEAEMFILKKIVQRELQEVHESKGSREVPPYKYIEL